MRIVAFDPGETTGWAYTNTEAPSKTPTIASGSFPNWEGVTKLISGFQPDVVVVETFTLYPWAMKDQTWSTVPTVEVIGVIKFICEQRGVPVKMQPAADAKALWLKKAQLRGGRHAVDAQKHVLAFLMREGLHEGYRRYYTQRKRRPKAPHRPK